MQETQIVKIKPSSSWFNLDLKDLWVYRELLYFLTLRDVKVRYKQTVIGVLWAILQPVLTTAIFTVIFTQFARLDSLQIPYPLFALSGLLLWLFVNTSIGTASNSLVNNSNLVTKIYFPRLIVPLAATLSGLIDLALGFLLLVGLMIYYGIAISWQIVFAPLFIALAILLALSFGMLFAALNVRFRDVKFALPFALQIWMFTSPIFYPASILSEKWQIWMFISPIFYPASILSEKWRFVFALNPLTGILEGFRAALFGGEFDWFAVGVSVAMTMILMVLSVFVFKRMEDDFADLI